MKNILIIGLQDLANKESRAILISTIETINKFISDVQFCI